MSTKIAWTGEVWNPVTGCTKVSAGCKNCYAASIARRFWGDRDFGEVRCHPERLEIPLHWKKPRRIFVNSMSDLFHEDVPFEFIARVYGHMHSARRHTFQVLTKRPERAIDFYKWYRTHWLKGFESALDREYGHIWLGISAETQADLDRRMPSLLNCPAEVRWVSIEPMLGPIQIRHWLPAVGAPTWFVVGCESGPGRRPCDPAWVKSIINQCAAAGVACFNKQMPVNGRVSHDPAEWPGEFRVRQFP